MSDEKRAKIALPNLGAEQAAIVRTIFSMQHRAYVSWKRHGGHEGGVRHMILLRAQSWVAWTAWSMWEERAREYRRRLDVLEDGFEQLGALISAARTDLEAESRNRAKCETLARDAFHFLAQLEGIRRSDELRGWLEQAVAAGIGVKDEDGSYRVTKEKA